MRKINVVPAVVFMTVMGFMSAYGQIAIAPNGERYMTTPFFDDFDGTSVSANWLVATWFEHGGQTGRERCFVEDGMLHMHFINSSTDGYLSAAMQTRIERFFGKWEFRAKPSSVAGVLNSFYTIDWDNTAGGTATRQEIDIEFLTKSFSGTSGQVHYALHASGKTSWDTRPDVDLGFNPSSDFHVYGFNILPDRIDWLVDSTVMRTYRYAGNPITITAPYQLKLNVWSSVNWIGGPPTRDVVCDYQVDWIKFTPYEDSPVMDDGVINADLVKTPTVEKNELSYWLARSSAVDFVLYDAAGVPVQQESKSTSFEGKYTIALDAPAAGIHYYTLATDAGTMHGRCIITR